MAPLASCMDDISVVHKTRKRVTPGGPACNLDGTSIKGRRAQGIA